jgi:hypothetical protein
MKPGLMRLALLLLCLCASTTQAWVAQLHVHATPVAQSGTAGSQQPATGDDERGGCLLCQIVAHGAGPALASAAPAFAPVVDVSFPVPAPRSAAQFVPPASHAWLSRGPPRG